jgi:hypothetical protein
MEKRDGPTRAQGSSNNFQRFNVCSMDLNAHGVAQDFRIILGFHDSAPVASI